MRFKFRDYIIQERMINKKKGELRNLILADKQ